MPDEMTPAVKKALGEAINLQAFKNESAGPYMGKAMVLVREYVESQFHRADPVPEFDVYVVWFSKVLQNWKALLSTTLPDQMYYEVTHNGDLAETYLDAYKKFNNVVIRDDVLSSLGG